MTTTKILIHPETQEQVTFDKEHADNLLNLQEQRNLPESQRWKEVTKPTKQNGNTDSK